MIKILTAIAIILALVSAFDLKREIVAPLLSEQDLKAIPWPYTVCGSGAAWSIESLTLAQTPKRNINDDIKVVRIIVIFRLALLTLQSLSREST